MTDSGSVQAPAAALKVVLSNTIDQLRSQADDLRTAAAEIDRTADSLSTQISPQLPIFNHPV